MKILVVANWKCNPVTFQEANQLFNSVKRGTKNIKNAEVVICPPFVFISNFKFQISNLKLGSQDVFWENGGAYTGEISPLMLKNMGVEYVIIGHSERRKYQKETNEMINKKLKFAFNAGLKPILCIDKISQIPRDIRKGFIVAYEPLFAIGTGRVCPAGKAKNMNFSIKKILGRNFPVLYGGSVNSENARDYIEEAEFNGLLVGGASLRPKEFIDIVKNIC